MHATHPPDLDRNDDASAEARAALAAFIEEIQRGLDERDADVYDRHFAGDVLWGSPYGLVLRGHDRLRAIHGRLLAEGRGGRSRYELEQALVPAPGVVLAHVRRTPRDVDGEPGAFSEMALYVLVRRDGDWWLAGGQNTPIVPNPHQPA